MTTVTLLGAVRITSPSKMRYRILFNHGHVSKALWLLFLSPCTNRITQHYVCINYEASLISFPCYAWPA
jgi:hypothetical protein